MPRLYQFYKVRLEGLGKIWKETVSSSGDDFRKKYMAMPSVS